MNKPDHYVLIRSRQSEFWPSSPSEEDKTTLVGRMHPFLSVVFSPVLWFIGGLEKNNLLDGCEPTDYETKDFQVIRILQNFKK